MSYDAISPHAQPFQNMDPGLIEENLGRLMRDYLRSRSAAVARAIAEHIEALICHPESSADQHERCVYHRLLRQWRWLAQESSRETNNQH